MASSAAFRSHGHWIVSHAPCGVQTGWQHGCGSHSEVGTVLCVVRLPVVYGTVTAGPPARDETHRTRIGTVERRIVDSVSFRMSLYIIYQPLVRSAAVHLSFGRAGAIAPKRTRTLFLPPPVRNTVNFLHR